MTHGFFGRTPAGRPFLGRTPILFFEPDTGINHNGGNGGQGNQGGDNRQDVSGLLARHQGDAMAVIATLLSENHTLRDERRALRGQVPAQGALVLTAEQAQSWQAYGQLGTVEALRTAVQERDQARTQVATLEREKLIREVARATGFKESVLSKLPGIETLTFEVREVEEQGKKEKRAFVKDGDKETPALQYAEANWSDFMPALTAQVQQQPSGTAFPRQSGSGKAATTNPVASHIQKTYKRGNK